MQMKVFVDFEGTITSTDTLQEFVKRFGNGTVENAMAGLFNLGGDPEIENIGGSAHSWYRSILESCSPVDESDIDEFCRLQTVDPEFSDFVSFCRSNGIQLEVVADGFDLIVGSILKNNDLGDVQFSANRLHLIPKDNGDGRRMELSFPFDDEECRYCAICKRNIIVSQSAESDIIVYVGDGKTDRCPVRYADVILAKPVLQHFCQDENITYRTFSTFGDAKEILSRLKDMKRLSKRSEAEINRRALFRAG